MPQISITTLEKIKSTPLTPELARNGRDITLEHAHDMMEVALHEAAHLVAAISAKGYISYVQICQTEKSKRYPAGSVQSAQILPSEDAFVSFAGVAQEWRIMSNKGDQGDQIDRSLPDQIQGVNESREADLNPLSILSAAQRFVADCEQVITYATVGILRLMTTKGRLEKARLNHLLKWLKPQVPPISKYLNAGALRHGVWNHDDLDDQRAYWLNQVQLCKHRL